VGTTKKVRNLHPEKERIELKPIALQLYTVREAAARDFPYVLRRVAEMGYKAVETAGLNGLKPEEMSRMVTDLGMKVCSSHTSMPTADNLQEIVDTEMALGNRMVVSGLGPDQFKTLDMCKEAVDQFNQAAELLKPHGMRFGIHNHWWEFETVDGNRVYDLLLKE
jgi:sugar phosphate isomerase/epimerase